MKRITTMILAAGMFTFVACGPSAEEKAAAEKAKQDSVAAVQKMADDSIAAATAAAEKATMDSMNMVMERMKADSIAAADAKHAKPKPKTIEQKKKEDMKILKKQKG
ncbi:MAG: hypothetical protein ABI763_06260 [Bacteroidota bacterium]